MAQNSEAQKVILISQALAAPLDLGRVGRVSTRKGIIHPA